MKKLRLTLLIFAITSSAMADNPKLNPTIANVSYGSHERQKLNFWKAESASPTPVVFYIQGGGWLKGGGLHETMDCAPFLSEGISLVSVSYRLSEKDTNLVPVPIMDVARAIQFVRYKAKEWGLDKSRIGLIGHSAGGCTSVWLALHDDLADPYNKDPILRESTKPTIVVGNAAQTFIDSKMVERQ